MCQTSTSTKSRSFQHHWGVSRPIAQSRKRVWAREVDLWRAKKQRELTDEWSSTNYDDGGDPSFEFSIQETVVRALREADACLVATVPAISIASPDIILRHIQQLDALIRAALGVVATTLTPELLPAPRPAIGSHIRASVTD